MRYFALATDYDGTLATRGQVDSATRRALERFVASGRRLVLVTGRQLAELEEVFPQLSLFEWIVAENGAVLFSPATRDVRALEPPPSPEFVAALRARGVQPLSVGHVIVATHEPHHSTVLEVIRSMGLELHVEFNKGSVMVLPAGVTKGTGLAAALVEMGLSEHDVVGVGDAENDHALLGLCERAVSVANALPSLKERSDWVTPASHGAGVAQLIDRILADDLRDVPSARRRLVLGQTPEGESLSIEARGESLLVTGPSRKERSAIAAALVDRLLDARYQLCVLDPSGQLEARPGAVVVGSADHAPTVEELARALLDPRRSVVATLVALPIEARAAWVEAFLSGGMPELRARTGRPHWVVVDDAHEAWPRDREPGPLAPSKSRDALLLLTGAPERVSRAVLGEIDVVLATGPQAQGSLRAFAEATGRPLPECPAASSATWLWRVRDRAGGRVVPVEVTPARPHKGPESAQALPG